MPINLYIAKDEEMNITNVGDRHSNDNEGKPEAMQ